MTEAEAYELLVLITSELNQLTFGYFSIISAFLVMSYFVANKLNNIHSTIILILFTLCSFYIVSNLYLLNNDLDNLIADMLLKKSQGVFELAWFGKNPPLASNFLTLVQVLIGLGGYICSIIFFYSNRKMR